MNLNELHVSIATPTDAAALAVLVNSAYRGDSSRKGWTTEADLLDGTRTDASAILEEISNPDTSILKFEYQGEVVCCVELRKTGHKLYLGMLTVRPDLQGLGLGKKLLTEAERFAVEAGCNKIYMTVISVRKELIAWYEKYGFRNTGEKKPFDINDPRFGLPRQKLEFVVLEKELN